MEESEAARLQQVANLEAELQSLKTTLQTKEEEIVTLKEEVANKVGVSMVWKVFKIQFSKMFLHVDNFITQTHPCNIQQYFMAIKC